MNKNNQLKCWRALYKQAAPTGLPDCPGQPLFGLGNHDLQKNCPTGQVQVESKLTPILSHKLQTRATNNKKTKNKSKNKNIKDYGLIGYTPST